MDNEIKTTTEANRAALPEAAPGYSAAQTPANEASYHAPITSHSFPVATGAQSYGHDVTQRHRGMRLSGHAGAHRIGKR